MSNPFFSIVIPVYNTIKELKRCVDSVVSQTFEDFELILVDDGSTDGSGELCDRLSAEDSRIKTIHRENGGCSEARNTGVRYATGRYLLFVDSDDMWDDTHALFELHKIANKNPVDVVCFGVAIYNEVGELVKIRKPVLPEEVCKNKYKIVKHLVYTNQYFSTSYVKMLRRDFFIKSNLFFVKGLLSEDIEWSARILLYCETIAVYSSAFYKRIQRSEGSITSAIGKKNITDILGSIEKGTELVSQQECDETLRVLYYEYWAYQYAMLLGLVPIIRNDKEYGQIFARLKKLQYLLRFDHVKKVKLVRFCNAVCGLNITVKLLSKYYGVCKR